MRGKGFKEILNEENIGEDTKYCKRNTKLKERKNKGKKNESDVRIKIKIPFAIVVSLKQKEKKYFDIFYLLLIM